MKKTSSFLAVFAAIATVLLTCFQAQATPVVITNVPAYNWYNGCYPTSLAMVLGYYALHDYKNMFNTNGPALYITSNIWEQISSSAHNAKYDNADNPSLPVPPLTSLADWLKTSVDPLANGETEASNLIPAIIGYTKSRGYFFSATKVFYRNDTTSWNIITNEIGSGRPMLFSVNTSSNGPINHLVMVIGYDEVHPVYRKAYACYNTDSEAETDIMWYKLQAKAATNSPAYSVSEMTSIKSKGRGVMIRVF